MTSLVPNVFAVVDGVSRAIAGHHRRAGSWTGIKYLLLAVGLIALVGIGIVLWERWQAARSRAGASGSLFDELALAHGLAQPERNVLARVAGLAGHDDPALVFVRPELLEHLVSNEVCDRTVADGLRTRLFGA